MRSRGRVTLGRGVALGPGVRFDVAPGARVAIRAGARLGARTRVHVRSGEVTIGAGAQLGDACVLVAHERVVVGARARLGDGVVLVDFDHVFGDVERPVRQQGLATAPVEVGAGTLLGPGAAVLRGVRVGDGARVGPHAVVTRDVAPGTDVRGVPAAYASGSAF